MQFRVGINNKRKMLSSSSQIPLNQWVHVAGTYDGSRMRVFINGQARGSLSVSGNIQDTSNPIYIGHSQFWPRHFDGRIDEVQVYNKALSNSEIAALHSSTSSARFFSEGEDIDQSLDVSNNNAVLYPNPLGNDKIVKINLTTPIQGTTKLVLFDITGMTLMEKSMVLEEGTYHVEMDLSDRLIEKGIFYLQLSNDSNNIRFKLMNN